MAEEKIHLHFFLDAVDLPGISYDDMRSTTSEAQLSRQTSNCHLNFTNWDLDFRGETDAIIWHQRSWSARETNTWLPSTMATHGGAVLPFYVVLKN